MSKILFLPRTKGEMYRRNPGYEYLSIDVSAYGKRPYKLLSPFTYSIKFKIPVPGMKGKFANSVESIWQGLKIINGNIDEKMFTKKQSKRRGRVEGHKYKNNILGLVRARWDIYVPSYKDYLDNFAPKDAISFILKEQRNYKQIYLYDIEDNDDINNPKPLAHSALLATYFNLKIFSLKFSPINKEEEELFKILDDKTITNEEKAKYIKPLLSNNKIMRAFKYRCVEHPVNIDDVNIANFFLGSKYTV